MSVRIVTLAIVLALDQLHGVSLSLAQPIPVAPEFQVNTYTTGDQFLPRVATDTGGNFVVIWTSYGSAESDTSSFSIQGQRYDSTGMPQGAQFQVNAYTTGLQTNPWVARNGAGDFVVVWTSAGSSGSDSSTYSVQAQRFASNGALVGGEFQVNTYTTYSQDARSIAIDSAGNFVVVWQSEWGDGSDNAIGVHAQRFDSAGVPVGGQFQVNTYTTDVQGNFVDVAMDAAGNFVVAWESWGGAGPDNYGFSVQGQRFDAGGAAVGSEFQINTYTPGGFMGPLSVDSDAAGNFVVVWTADGSDGSDTTGISVQARRFDSGGVALTGQFQVNAHTTGDQMTASVASDAAGNFLVLWASDPSPGLPDGNGRSIQGQQYDSAGVPKGGQFQVNSWYTGEQLFPSAFMADDGNIVVTWISNGGAGSDTEFYAVQARRFTRSLVDTELIPGAVFTNRQARLAKFVAKPVVGDTFPLPSSSPVLVGGSLRAFDMAATAGDDTYNLPAGAVWKGLGNPPGSKGYKYKGTGTPSDPCKIVLVKEKVIKGVCVGSGITLTPPFTGDVGIVLSLGTTDRYCAQFGGDEVKNDATLTKRKNAQAPAVCP